MNWFTLWVNKALDIFELILFFIDKFLYGLYEGILVKIFGWGLFKIEWFRSRLKLFNRVKREVI
jgi:hypothetical protein